MKAMILAAGFGKRMRPLTETTPKPLLEVAGKCLIEYHIENIAKAGIKEIVINTHWLAEKIPQSLGSGERWGVSLQYSHEPDILETAGGILQALPTLCERDSQFLVVNGDVYSELDLARLLAQAPRLSEGHQAYLALVPNPDHHPEGDFGIDSGSSLLKPHGQAEANFTYSGVGLYHRSLFQHLSPGRHALGPLLREGIEAGRISGEVSESFWLDVGTPERLEQLRRYLKSLSN